MDTLLNNFGTIVLYIGVIDAAAMLIMGIICAALYLFNVEAKYFWERVIPATLILVATSFGAGVIMLIARWVAHWIG